MQYTIILKVWFHVCSVSMIARYVSTAMKLEARERLAALVKKARGDMSKSAFGEMLGVSHTAVGSWEQGSCMPDVRIVMKISARLGLTVEEFISAVDGRSFQGEKKGFSYVRVVNEIDSMPTNDQLEVFRFLSDRVVQMAGSK